MATINDVIKKYFIFSAKKQTISLWSDVDNKEDDRCDSKHVNKIIYTILYTKTSFSIVLWELFLTYSCSQNNSALTFS